MDNTCTFDFTFPWKREDGKKEKSVYFELAEKLEPHKDDRARFPPSKADYPMNEIRAGVDVLLADGKLRVPTANRSK